MAAENANVFMKYLADEAIFKQIVGDDGSPAPLLASRLSWPTAS
jgi:hypothetical protein